MNIFAYTESTPAAPLLPAYLSVNKYDDGSVHLTVRQRADALTASTATIALPADVLESLAESLSKYLAHSA